MAISRRGLLTGSTVLAGVGAVAATTLDFSLFAAAPPIGDKTIRSLREQMRVAFGKVQQGDEAGAIQGAAQLATLLRTYASTVDDAMLQQQLKKADRRTILDLSKNHARIHRELERQAVELGLDLSKLPVSFTANALEREAALNRLIKEGLSPQMEQLADTLDGIASAFTALRRRRVALVSYQPIPECGNCSSIASLVSGLEAAMTAACAVSAFFPPAAEACAAACAAWASAQMAWTLCEMYVRWCQG